MDQRIEAFLADVLAFAVLTRIGAPKSVTLARMAPPVMADGQVFRITSKAQRVRGPTQGTV
jgi:hypothetical protein